MWNKIAVWLIKKCFSCPIGGCEIVTDFVDCGEMDRCKPWKYRLCGWEWDLRKKAKRKTRNVTIHHFPKDILDRVTLSIKEKISNDIM